MEYKKVLFISQEIVPYLPSTAMAELCRHLPQGIAEKGCEVRTFMPKYGSIKERRNQLHEVIRLSGLNIEIDDADHPLIIKVATLQPARMQVYFIDNEDYFYRSNADGLETALHPQDNDERSIFFVRGVAETVKKLRWYPEVIHISGWIGALAPMYLRRTYADDPQLAQTKVVYSVFSDNFGGTLDARFQEKLMKEGFNANDIKALGSDPADWKALTRLAIDYADAIAQADANTDPEILEYIKASGKPFLPFPGDEGFASAYAEFYASL